MLLFGWAELCQRAFLFLRGRVGGGIGLAKTGGVIGMKMMTVDRNRKPKRGLASKLLHEQKGQMLIEVLVAMAILGVVAVAFLSAMVTSYGAVALADRKTTAESLTRTELERVKDAPYPIVDYTRISTSSAPPSPPPSGYRVEVTAVYIVPPTYVPGTAAGMAGMQMITVKVVTVRTDGSVIKVVSITNANKVQG